MQRYAHSIILFVLFTFSFHALAQERLTLEQSKTYILGQVRVTGKITFNEQTVVTFAGLEKGQPINVPGEQITAAIKKLGKLGLFNDINFYVNEIRNDTIFLELNINELPKLNNVKFTGIKKGKVEELLKELSLNKGKIVNDNLLTTTKNYIDNKYKKEGYYLTKTTINTVADTTAGNAVNMTIFVDKGKKVKISAIDIEGNSIFSDRKIRGAMSNTKQINRLRIFKASKYIKNKYKEDLVSVIDKYKENGYRDARIVKDSVYLDPKKKKIAIQLKIDEGHKYYFGNIKFLGNTIYKDEMLHRMLGIQKGDVYNGVLLEKRISDKKKPDGEDILNLYQNNGYLFSNINPVEVRTSNDTIDFEIRILEGPIAYFNKITVVGNDKTNDKVIYREIRTRPGQKYSKDDVVRTVREIGQLGFFDPEAIDPQFKNVDASSGTVDIEYHLAEKGSSQIELQGGYGAGGFIGTLGLSFNNFSMGSIFKKDAYKPLPMGDGQKMSLRLQGSTFFQTYSLSFSEPWFGGKKPISFNTSLSFSKQYLYNYASRDVDKNKSFNIISLNVGLAKRLKVPDDYFVLSSSMSFQYYQLNNYNTGLFTFGNGTSRNVAFNIGLTRNNKGVNPIYPTYGAEFSVNAKFTVPYSLFNGVDYANLSNLSENKLRNDTGTGYFGTDGVWIAPGDYITAGVRATDFTTADIDRSKVDQKKYGWLEFYKVKFKADWYTRLFGKLVLRSMGEFAFLGAYNNNRGLVPFERFFLGGDGLANFSMDGREIVQLRGYPNQSLSSNSGSTIYNKFTMELRYPITLKAAATIYGLTFMEAGAGYDNYKDFNPFSLYRSAGFGLRVFMPAFGLLGIDFAHGFDALPGQTQKNGWETHFIIGQQF